MNKKRRHRYSLKKSTVRWLPIPARHAMSPYARQARMSTIGAAVVSLLVADLSLAQDFNQGTTYQTIGEFPVIGQSSGTGGFSSRRRSSLGGAPGGRSSFAGWQSFASSKARDLNEGTAKVGTATLELNLSAQVEYDSNINSSGQDPIADIGLAPQIRLDIRWPITRQNELNIELGVQYQHYVFHPEYSSNGLVIDPGTVIEWKLYTGDFVITIYDSPEVATDPGDDPGVFNTVNFQQLNNIAGIAVLQDLNLLINTVGVERRDIRSLSGTFTSENSTAYTAYGSSFYSVTPTTRVGIRGAATETTYEEDALNNSLTALGGLVLSSRFSDNTQYYLEGGIQSAHFSDNGNQQSEIVFEENDGFNDNVEGTLGGGDYLQPYAVFRVSNRLNHFYNHSLLIQRQATGSSVANYTESNTFAYLASMQLTRLVALDFRAAYEFGTIAANEAPIHYQRWQSQVDLSFDITRDISLDFFYQYLLNDVAISNGSYDRQRVGVAASWTF